MNVIAFVSSLRLTGISWLSDDHKMRKYPIFKFFNVCYYFYLNRKLERRPRSGAKINLSSNISDSSFSWDSNVLEVNSMTSMIANTYPSWLNQYVLRSQQATFVQTIRLSLVSLHWRKLTTPTLQYTANAVKNTTISISVWSSWRRHSCTTLISLIARCVLPIGFTCMTSDLWFSSHLFYCPASPVDKPPPFQRRQYLWAGKNDLIWNLGRCFFILRVELTTAQCLCRPRLRRIPKMTILLGKLKWNPFRGRIIRQWHSQGLIFWKSPRKITSGAPRSIL